ncbi:MAG: hydantoinase/oxoprolinase family protein [Actinomycetota bacterium]|nr:hydantoinase/oxoprolinase family protein [Actinomycetota bacterium]
MRAGVDAGGTFIDVVGFDASDRKAHPAKVPSDAGVAAGLDRCAPLLARAPDTVVAGTTRITNAVLAGSLARTALVTTEGFRDVLAIGRQARDDLYDLRRPARVPPPVPRDLCFEVAERVASDGSILVPLAEGEVERVASAVRAAGVEAVAVSLLHAYARPEHERRLAEGLRGVALSLSVSHRVSRERREFERASTTALNGALLPAIDHYVEDLRAAVKRTFPRASAFVIHSAGGMMTLERTRRLPLATVMSGPAAGVAATARLARRLALERAVSLDMGGTSTDVCLLTGGVPASARDRRVGGHVIRLPAVAVESIGAGGGSIAAVDDVGALRVGPRSAGADPGPAAYGRGGTEATVTDADVVLGLAGSWGGLSLDADLAQEACARLGTRLGLSAEETARAVLAVAHAEIDRALRLVTVRRGHDLRDCTLVAYGGAGPMHAGAVALSAGIRRVLVPALSSTFSAFGCCLAELAVDDVRTCTADLSPADWPRVEETLEKLVADVADELADGRGRGALRAVRSLELRYRGQNEALEVELEGSSIPAVRAAFRERHRSEFGYATEEPIEVTGVRARLWLDEGASWGAPERTATELEVGGTAFGPVLARGALEPGRPVVGPAVLVDELSTVVVLCEQTARADEDGNVWIERPR